MKRDNRSFVVEIKRSQKRPVTPNDGVWKQEHKTNKRPKTAASASESKLGEKPPVQRRILDVLDQPSFQPVINSAVENNGPRLMNSNVKIAALPPSRVSGRLKFIPDNAQKTVPIPETSSAPVQSTSIANFEAPKTQLPKCTNLPTPLFEPPKRKRGRPRKIRPPKFDWTEWMVDGESVTLGETADAQKPTTTTQVMASHSVIQGQRLRVGERWKCKRRNRGEPLA